MNRRQLLPIDLPPAPAVTRAPGRAYRRPRAPAWALAGLGAVLILGPVIGGMFSKTVAGKQMVERFGPYMEPNSLARYSSDLAVLRRGAAGVQAVYLDQSVATGAYPGLDVYLHQSGAIDGRAQSLLDKIVATAPDYRQVAAIGGFDRLPFLLVFEGMIALYGGAVLLAGA